MTDPSARFARSLLAGLACWAALQAGRAEMPALTVAWTLATWLLLGAWLVTGGAR